MGSEAVRRLGDYEIVVTGVFTLREEEGRRRRCRRSFRSNNHVLLQPELRRPTCASRHRTIALHPVTQCLYVDLRFKGFKPFFVDRPTERDVEGTSDSCLECARHRRRIHDEDQGALAVVVFEQAFQNRVTIARRSRCRRVCRVATHG